MDGVSLNTVGEFEGHFPLCFDGTVLYSSRGTDLYRWDDLASPRPQFAGALPRAIASRTLALARPVERMLRLGISHLAITPTRNVAVCDKSVFTTSSKQLTEWRRVGRLGGPLSLLPGGRPMRFGVTAQGEDVLIGEYRSNGARGAMTVQEATEDGLAPRFVFAAGTVRHVHAVQCDPFTQELWAATGDYGRECRILRSRDGMRTVDVVGSGDQTWRATAFVFDRDAVYWGMDSPLERCFIYRWNRATGERAVVGEASGPIWHATSNANGWSAFSTAVEPSHRFRDRTSYLHVRHANRAGGQLHTVARYGKDSLSARWFQPGLIFFPTGIAPEDFLVFSASGLTGIDDRMIVARLVG